MNQAMHLTPFPNRAPRGDKCPYHDRLEAKVDSTYEMARLTREDVAFLRGRATANGATSKILTVLVGFLVAVGGAIAYLLQHG